MENGSHPKWDDRIKIWSIWTIKDKDVVISTMAWSPELKLWMVIINFLVDDVIGHHRVALTEQIFLERYTRTADLWLCKKGSPFGGRRVADLDFVEEIN